MSKVYFLCGLAASGKSTLARRLEREKGAVRFTMDERMLAQTDLSIFDDEYGRLVQREKEKIWREALMCLRDGQDVILDWSLWSRAARTEWTERVIAAGYDYHLFYLATPIETLRERLANRNQNPGRNAHVIPFEEVERFSHIFEPPTPEENLNLEIITSYS
ncbi:MAG: ATP-binding protein [Ardenticatenaceae bacterium]|nr:ATP-binding protein [Ardenticatenaceae bacterium]